MLLAVCVKCSWREKACAGPCLCTKDGKDIKEHAKHAYCPIGKFDGLDPDAPVPSRDEVCNALWLEAHTQTCPTPKWFADWSSRVPCGRCRKFLTAYVAEHPPDFSSPEAFFVWMVGLHDGVNVELDRPVMGVAAATARWRPARID